MRVFTGCVPFLSRKRGKDPTFTSDLNVTLWVGRYTGHMDMYVYSLSDYRLLIYIPRCMNHATEQSVFNCCLLTECSSLNELCFSYHSVISSLVIQSLFLDFIKLRITESVPSSYKVWPLNPGWMVMVKPSIQKSFQFIGTLFAWSCMGRHRS